MAELWWIKALTGTLLILALLPVLLRERREDRHGTRRAIALTLAYFLAMGLVLMLVLPMTGPNSSDGRRAACAAVMIGAMATGLVWLVHLLPSERHRPPPWLRSPRGWFGILAHLILLGGVGALLAV